MDARRQQHRVDRLLQVVDRAQLDRRDGARERRVPGHQHHDRAGGQVAAGAEDLLALVPPVEHHVRDHRIEGLGAQEGDRGGRRAGQVDLESLPLEHGSEQFDRPDLVVDQKDVGAAVFDHRGIPWG